MTELQSPFDTRRCPLERYLDVLSGKWSVRIVWLLLQPREPWRFAELQRSLAGISSKVLTDRLRMLEREGLVLRAETAGYGAQHAFEYSMTARGARLAPVFREMETAAAHLFPEDR